MRTPLFIKIFLNAAALLGLGLLAIACGVEKEPHYHQEKTFGKTADPETAPSEIIKIQTAPNEVLSKDLDPQTIAFQGNYKGFMDAETFELLNDQAKLEQKPEEDRAISVLKAMLPVIGSRPADLTVSQTLGNSLRSIFSQLLISPSDDSMIGNILEGPSDSREQKFVRVVGMGACPSTFVCVSEQVYLPNKNGSAKKFCYYDLSSGKPTAIPYTPSPHSKAADFAEAFKTYPDYVALEFSQSIPESCTEDLATMRTRAAREELFRIRIEPALGDVPDMRYASSDSELPIQFGIKVDIVPLAFANGVVTEVQDDKKPYLDDRLVMQTNTTYYLNEDKKILVKFVKTVRKAIKKTVTSRLSYIPGLGALFKSDGLKVDYHFEFCQDHTDSQKPGPNLCK
jgi:hypothetical protein